MTWDQHKVGFLRTFSLSDISELLSSRPKWIWVPIVLTFM